MRSMHAALCKVGEVPHDQLDVQIKLWAGEVRELSFDMEDIVDKFLVRVDGGDDSEPVVRSSRLKRLTKKMASLFSKGKGRHQIADAIKDINMQLQDVARRRERYTVDTIVAGIAPATTIDSRLKALYREVTELEGIAGKRYEELINLLSGDSVSTKKLKIISVVGFGGLGKTTLVKTVYDKIKRDFDCTAFVPVGQNADAKKVFKDILSDLGMHRRDLTDLDERQLIDKLRAILHNKRYVNVICVTNSMTACGLH
jgi:ATPase subunit of ABC transporter with duplicated ATPase domains